MEHSDTMVYLPFKRKKTIFDSKLTDNYDNYLKSKEWKEIRERIKERANGKCELCSVSIGNKGHVHHTCYDNLFEEKDEDLLYLCSACHNEV